MSVRPITIVGHRALEQRTRRVREVTYDIRTLVADMFETNDAADGAGLAALAGRSRAGACSSTRAPTPTAPCSAEWSSIRGSSASAGSSSTKRPSKGASPCPAKDSPPPGIAGAGVTRHRSPRAEIIVEDEGGVLSRALQHEVDHLDGSPSSTAITRPRAAARGPGRGDDRGWRTHRTLMGPGSRGRDGCGRRLSGHTGTSLDAPAVVGWLSWRHGTPVPLPSSCPSDPCYRGRTGRSRGLRPRGRGLRHGGAAARQRTVRSRLRRSPRTRAHW